MVVQGVSDDVLPGMNEIARTGPGEALVHERFELPASDGHAGP